MEAAADPPVEDEAASGEGEPPHQTEEEAPVEAQEPEAVPDFIPFLEDDLETEDRYPVGSYIDEAGNVWSQEGELLSPGTTPALEPVEALGEPVTGEPTIDTALLLVDLLEALTGEEGMSSDMDSVQQVLDHPAMTTSFQDYTVKEIAAASSIAMRSMDTGEKRLSKTTRSRVPQTGWMALRAWTAWRV